MDNSSKQAVKPKLSAREEEELLDSVYGKLKPRNISLPKLSASEEEGLLDRVYGKGQSRNVSRFQYEEPLRSPMEEQELLSSGDNLRKPHMAPSRTPKLSASEEEELLDSVYGKLKPQDTPRSPYNMSNFLDETGPDVSSTDIQAQAAAPFLGAFTTPFINIKSIKQTEPDSLNGSISEGFYNGVNGKGGLSSDAKQFVTDIDRRALSDWYNKYDEVKTALDAEPTLAAPEMTYQHANYGPSTDNVQQEDYGTDYIRNRLTHNADGSLSLNGKQLFADDAEAESYLQQYYEDKSHQRLMETSQQYRDKYFVRATGQTESHFSQAFKKKVIASLDDIEKKLLQSIEETRGKELRGISDFNDLLDIEDGGTQFQHYERNKSTNLLDRINNIKKELGSSTKSPNENGAGFWKGLWGGGSLLENLTPLLGSMQGLNDAQASLDIVSSLKRVSEGGGDERDKILAELARIDSGVQDYIAMKGGKSMMQGLGEIINAMPTFMWEMGLTGGVESAVKAGVGRLATEGVKKAMQGTVKSAILNGTDKVLTSIGGAALRTPLMSQTYKNYGDRRLAQYSWDNKALQYSPSSAWSDAYKAYVDQFFEVQSEDFGMWIDRGLSALGKSLAGAKMMRKIGMLDKLSPTMDHIRRNLKIASPIGELSGELYGDLVSPIFNGEKDWQQMYSSDYWWQLGLSTVGMSCFFGALNAPHIVSQGRAINQSSKSRDAALKNIGDIDLRKSLVSISALPSIAERSDALSKIRWDNISKVDAAYTADYINASTRMDILRDEDKESARLKSFYPIIAATTNNMYKGSDGKTLTGTIITAKDSDGEVVNVIGGDINNNEALLFVRRADGKLDAISHSAVTELSTTQLNDVLSEQYAMMFNQSIAKDRLSELESIISQATENGFTDKEVQDIITNKGFTYYTTGDEVTLTNGTTGIVDDMLGDGSYLIRTEDGNVSKVGFSKILQSDVVTAQAQMADEQGPSADEVAEPASSFTQPQTSENTTTGPAQKANDIFYDYEVGDVIKTRDGLVGRISTIDTEHNPYIIDPNDALSRRVKVSYRDVVSMATEDEASNASAYYTKDSNTQEGVVTSTSPDVQEIPHTDKGAIDYDKITDPQLYCTLIAKELDGSDMSVAEFLSGQITSTRSEIENLTKKRSAATNTNEGIALIQQIKQLKSQLAVKEEALRLTENLGLTDSSNRQTEVVTNSNKGSFEYFKGSINDFIVAAKSAGSSVIKKIISPVNEKLINDLADKGLVVSKDFNHIIDNSGVNHTVKQHSSSNEIRRGQIPITEEDFNLADDVVNNYDSVDLEPDVHQTIVKYTKRYNDGTIVYVEEVRNGRNELALKTLYKKKNSSSLDEHLNKPSSHTPEATSSSTTISAGKDTKVSPNANELVEKNAVEKTELQKHLERKVVAHKAAMTRKQNGGNIGNAKEIQRLFPDGIPSNEYYLQTLADIASGQKFIWDNNSDNTKRGIATELGLTDSKEERKVRFNLLAGENAGGVYFDDYVASLYEQAEGYDKGINDNDIRNDVIEVLHDITSSKAAMEKLRKIAEQGDYQTQRDYDYDNNSTFAEESIINDGHTQKDIQAHRRQDGPTTIEQTNGRGFSSSTDNGSRVADETAKETPRVSHRGDIRVFEEGLGAQHGEHPEYSERDRREAESERLVSVAKQNGLFITPSQTKLLGEEYPKKTGESTVYRNEAEGKDYKVKDPYAKSTLKNGVQPEDAIYEHIVHNLLFPETKYTFEGISEDLGNVRIVLSQDIIQSFGQPTKSQIAEALATKGLYPEDNYYFGNNLVSVTDVEGDNTLLGEDGVVYFIDPIIQFKKSAKEIISTLDKSVTAGYSIEKRFHKKNGSDIYAVKFDKKVNRDDFIALKFRAKNFGGYYSSYGKGGFIFDTIADARKFGEDVVNDNNIVNESTRTDINAPISLSDIAKISDNNTRPISMFGKKNSVLDNTTDIVETPKGNGNDTATPENAVSEDEDTTIIPKNQDTENAQPQEVDVEGLFNTLSSQGTAKLSDHTNAVNPSDNALMGRVGASNDIELAVSAEGKSYAREGDALKVKRVDRGQGVANVLLNGEKQMLTIPELAEALRNGRWQEQSLRKNEGALGLVSDERMAELKERLRKKLGGQLNVGIDPEILAIGMELAAGHIDRGVKKFADFATVMVDDLGDVIRPYLKAFYNGARDMPELRNYMSEMSPYDEVRVFDTANFDKPTPNITNKIDTVATELAIEEQTKHIQQELRNYQSTSTEGSTASAQQLRPATESDLRGNPVVYYKGKPYRIMMIINKGSQVGAGQFERPHIVGVYLANGQRANVDELSVEDITQIQSEDNNGGEKTISSQEENNQNTSENGDSRDTVRESVHRTSGRVSSEPSEGGVQGESARAQAGDRESGRESIDVGGEIPQGVPTDVRHGDNGVSSGDNSTSGRLVLGKQRGDIHLGNGGQQDAASVGQVQGVVNNSRNFAISAGTELAPKGDVSKIKANLAAIKLAKKLNLSGAIATPEQMNVLSQYTGWGGLSSVFKEDNDYNGQLREILTDEQYDSARKSTTSSFYTPTSVIEKMWDAISRLGFKGGNILEPSGGIGNIYALMPNDIKSASTLKGIELDDVSGMIFRLLYPDAKIQTEGYENVVIPNNSLDLVVTNVPFGAVRLYDSNEKDISKRFDIHDFFIAKSLRKLKPGGLGVFITTTSTMDRSNELREWIISEGNSDIIGAVRLNTDTFKSNAGTEASSDIIVIRKRDSSGKSPYAIDASVIATAREQKYIGKTPTRWGDYKESEETATMRYNKYFVEHPEFMAGEMKFGFEGGNALHPTEQRCAPSPTIDQASVLSAFVNDLPQDIYSQDEIQDADIKESFDNTNDDKEGSLVVHGSTPCIVSMGKLVPMDWNSNKVAGYDKSVCVEDYIALKQALNKLLDAEVNDSASISEYRKALNTQYDLFTSRYGELSENRKVSFLSSDVDFPAICAIENVKSHRDVLTGKTINTITKADIFSKRVVGITPELKIESASDGVLASKYKYGTIRPSYIAELLNRDVKDVEKELLSSGRCFIDPATGLMQSREDYLSGNVVQKLVLAKQANISSEYDNNIQELDKVIPDRIPLQLINISLGNSWIPTSVYQRFFRDTFGINVKLQLTSNNTFICSGEKAHTDKNEYLGLKSDYSRKLGSELALDAMNNISTQIYKPKYDLDGKRGRELDKEATVQAGAKQNEIRELFEQYCKNDGADFAQELENIYNDTFNALVEKRYDISHFTSFPGATDSKKPRNHQREGTLRALDGATLLAHEVGTGKTITLISTAMEMRRLGLAKKVCIVVQRSTLGQFVGEIKSLYPQAKILMPSEKDLTKAQRENLFAKIAYNDWDIVVLYHSYLDSIPDDPSRVEAYIDELIQEKVDLLNELADSRDSKRARYFIQKEIDALKDKKEKLRGDSVDQPLANKTATGSVKQIEKAKQKAESRARRLLDRRTDNVRYFEQLGIDALLIDEAHAYKRLGFVTNIKQVKGIDTSASERAQSMKLKTSYILESHNNHNVVFATGTPISNTMAEMWTYMRYLLPKTELKRLGINTFDSFVHNFGEIEDSAEFGTNGKFKIAKRFSKYINIPELLSVWKGIAHTVLTEDVKDLGANAKMPKLQGGKPTDVFLPQTPTLKGVMKSIKKQLEAFEQMSGAEKKANSHIPLVMFGLAKRAAIDCRLVDPTLPDDAGSKTNKAVDIIVDDLQQTQSTRGTVAVFCDDKQSSDGRFVLFRDMAQKLIARGIPREQIALIDDYKTDKSREELFKLVNEGSIRIIMGSTDKLGVGVNIQDKLHLLVHLDAPMRPSDYQQRNGRILRQGNNNETVNVVRLGVEQTLDVTGYQRLKIKERFIQQIMKGDVSSRTMEEEESDSIDTSNFSHMMASLSGSEAALALTVEQSKYNKLVNSKVYFEKNQIYIANEIHRNKYTIEHGGQRLTAIRTAQTEFERLFPMREVTKLSIGKKSSDNAEEFEDFLRQLFVKKIDNEIGEFRGDLMRNDARITLPIFYANDVPFTVTVELSRQFDEQHRMRVNKTVHFESSKYPDKINGVAGANVERVIAAINAKLSLKPFEDAMQEAERDIERAKQYNAFNADKVNETFPAQERLDKSAKEIERLQELMKQELAAIEAKEKAEDQDVKEVSIDVEEEADVRYRYIPTDIEIERAGQAMDVENRIKELAGYNGNRIQGSVYTRGETEDGQPWVIRVSDHVANMDNFNAYDDGDAMILSLVVKDDFKPGEQYFQPLSNEEEYTQLVINPRQEIDWIRLKNGIEYFKKTGQSFSVTANVDSDVVYRDDQSSITSKADKISQAYGINTDIVIADTEQDFYAKMAQYDVPETLIDRQAVAVYIPTVDKILINASLTSTDEELVESIIHEESHRITRLSQRLYDISDVVDSIEEKKMLSFAQDIFGRPYSALVTADEIISYIVGSSALLKLNGRYILRDYISDNINIEQVIDTIKSSYSKDVANYKDIIDAFIPFIKATIETLKNQHTENERKTSVQRRHRIIAGRGFQSREGVGTGDKIVSETNKASYGTSVSSRDTGKDSAGGTRKAESQTDQVGSANTDNVLTARLTEQERAQVVSHARNLCERLGVPVRIVESTSSVTVNGKRITSGVKGLFNTKTNEVVIVADNNVSIADVQATVLHEVVGHYGMRRLLGKEKYNVLLDSIWDSLSEDAQSRLLRQESTTDPHIAVDELLATIAEGEITPSLYDKVIAAVRNFFRENVGIDLQITQSDIEYLLWKSRNNLLDTHSITDRVNLKANDIRIQKRLYPDTDMDMFDNTEESVRFRTGLYLDESTGEYREYTPSELQEKQQTIEAEARKARKRILTKVYNSAIRIFQDRMKPVSDFQKQLSKLGVKIDETNNYYDAENRFTSRAKVRMDKFQQKFTEPMLDIIRDIATQTDLGYDNITDYILAESAYEREFNGVGALSTDDPAWDIMKVTGIINATRKRIIDRRTSLLHNKGVKCLSQEEQDKLPQDVLFKLKSVGFDSLSMSEQQMCCNTILDVMWDKINAMNIATLQYLVDGGLKTREEIEKIRSRNWKYYVPLLSWDLIANEKKDAKKEFDFDTSVDAERRHAGLKLHRAEGRTTKPDDPLKAMIHRGQRAIMESEVNKSKLYLLQLLNDAQDAGGKDADELFRIDKVYYYKHIAPDGSSTWVKTTDIPSPDDLAKAKELHQEINKIKSTLKDLWRQKASYELDWLGVKVPTSDEYRAIQEQIGGWTDKLLMLESEETIRVEAGDFDMQGEIPLSDSEDAKRIVELYQNGTLLSVKFVDPQIATAIRGERSSKIAELADGLFNKRGIGTFTRWMSAAYTTLSPAFIVKNIVRDTLHAEFMHYMDAENGQIAGYNRHALIHGATTMSAIYRGNNGTAEPLTMKELQGFDIFNRSERAQLSAMYGDKRVMDTLYDYFIVEGGQTGFVHIQNTDKLELELRHHIAAQTPIGARYIAKRYNPLSLYNKCLTTMSECAEDMSRFSTFLANLDAGKSVYDSVTQAKNITVNFNRKGELSGALGSLYIFFNAQVQALEQEVRVMGRNPRRALEVAFSYAAIGYLNTWYALFIGSDDDDLDAEQLQDYTLEDNFVFPLFGKKKGRGAYIKIPQPQGLRTFFKIGSIMAQWSMDKLDSRNVASRLLNSVFDETLIGYQGNREIGRIFVPTALLPFYDIAVNKDAFGRPIYQDNKYSYRPDSESGMKNVGEIYYYISKGLNAIGRGNEYRGAGMREDGSVNMFMSYLFDHNPSKMAYIVQQYTGGSIYGGTTMKQLYSLFQPLWNEYAEYNTKDVPIVSSFIGTTYATSPASDFYDTKERLTNSVKVFESELDGGLIDKTNPQYIIRSRQKELFNKYDRRIRRMIRERNAMDDKPKEYKDKQKDIDHQMRLCNKILEDVIWSNDDAERTEQIKEIEDKYAQ